MDFVDPSWESCDPPLSPDGVVQAKETGIRLRNEGIRHIFASPFLRTVETAHHIAEALDLSIKIEHGACEWMNPDWFPGPPVYVPINEMRTRFPRIDEGYESMAFPSFPENPEERDARCRKAALLLADAYKSTSILVVGHGASVVGMTRGLLGSDCSVSCGLSMGEKHRDRLT
jgi:broad specificity phosphatase PhoE